MKKFFTSMFTDERGAISHKRVIGTICTLFLCVTMMLNSYSHETIKPADSLVNAVLTLGCVCIAGTTVDKFSKKSTTSESKDSEQVKFKKATLRWSEK